MIVFVISLLHIRIAICWTNLLRLGQMLPKDFLEKIGAASISKRDIILALEGCHISGNSVLCDDLTAYYSVHCLSAAQTGEHSVNLLFFILAVSARS